MKAELVIVLAPPAGSEPEVVVPAHETWLVHSAKGFFTTDATVIDREVRFIVDNPVSGQGTYSFFPSSVLQAAGQSRNYTFADAGYRGAGAVNVGVVVGVGTVAVPAGSRIRVSTTNLQAGDAWKELFLIVEKFDNSAKK